MTTAPHSARYTVAGMSCGHCETAIREEVSQVPAVTDLEVSAETGILTVTSDAPVDDAAILAAVDEAGYEATPAGA
ncbi:MAG: heavy metal-associated domain-containing protein [Brachybacterium sp.]|nr:heavy metal-associated domain-containing protein [Brachybacterium sp.]